MREFSVNSIYQATYVYLVLPLLLFLGGWLNYGWATLFCLLLGIAFYKSFAFVKTNEGISGIGYRTLFIFAVVATIWCFFAGIGYFYYQSFDYHFRNAVFRDLILYEWPVFYNRADTPMVYYMGYWLVPAILAKISNIFIQNAYLNFWIANVFLFIYAVIGVVLIFAQLAVALRINKIKHILTAIFIFIIFSGLDAIGILFFRYQGQPFKYHLDWWATFIQYSSITTAMFWVFNQFIPTALLTLLVYNERNIKSFGFLIVISLFFAPYPAAGIGVLMLAYAMCELWKNESKKDFIIIEFFSVQNLIGVFWLLPVVILYFITNSDGIDKLWYVFDYTTPKRLLVFMVLEFLLYAMILLPRFRKNIFFVTAIVSMIIIPFFRIDQQNNFCMRASLPALILLAMFVIRYLFETTYEKKNILGRLGLIILLFIGFATPFTEFYRGMYYVNRTGKIDLVADNIYTLNKKIVKMPVFGWDANHQFTAKNYRTDIFWQFLAKDTGAKIK